MAGTDQGWMQCEHCHQEHVWCHNCNTRQHHPAPDSQSPVERRGGYCFQCCQCCLSLLPWRGLRERSLSQTLLTPPSPSLSTSSVTTTPEVIITSPPPAAVTETPPPPPLEVVKILPPPAAPPPTPPPPPPQTTITTTELVKKQPPPTTTAREAPPPPPPTTMAEVGAARIAEDEATTPKVTMLQRSTEDDHVTLTSVENVEINMHHNTLLVINTRKGDSATARASVATHIDQLKSELVPDDVLIFNVDWGSDSQPQEQVRERCTFILQLISRKIESLLQDVTASLNQENLSQKLVTDLYNDFRLRLLGLTKGLEVLLEVDPDDIEGFIKLQQDVQNMLLEILVPRDRKQEVTWKQVSHQPVQCMDERLHVQEIRVVIVGRDGLGKSSLGNSLAGDEVFETGHSFSATTLTSSVCSRTRGDKVFKIVDTPDLIWPVQRDEETKGEVLRGLDLASPGPHVFLFVFHCYGRYLGDSHKVLQWLTDLLTEDVMNFTVLVFTHIDAEELDRRLRHVPDEICRLLLEKASNRCVAIDNKCSPAKKTRQVNELYRMIMELAKKNNYRHYQLPRTEAVASGPQLLQ